MSVIRSITVALVAAAALVVAPAAASADQHWKTADSTTVDNWPWD